MPQISRVSLLQMVRAFLPMIVVFLWDALINNPFGWYGQWRNLDTVMHVVGGFVTAWTIIQIMSTIKPLQKSFASVRGLQVVLTLSLVSTVTIIWELYEFALDTYGHLAVPMTLGDSLGDMVNGLIGASLFLFVYYHVHGTRSSSQIKHHGRARRRK